MRQVLLKNAKLRVAILTSSVLMIITSCSQPSRQELPEDRLLTDFIHVNARCAYIDRAFSQDPVLLREEFEQVKFPDDWDGLVDSLIVRYGTNAEFWHGVFLQILVESQS